jgi:hypothetical protein
MMVVDFQHEGRPRCGSLFGAGSGTGGLLFISREIARKTQLPRPDGRLRSLVGRAEVGKSEGVHKVHTLGFGPGRTVAGLGRKPVSSPTSGTCFPCSGACGPLSVHKVH